MPAALYCRGGKIGREDEEDGRSSDTFSAELNKEELNWEGTELDKLLEDNSPVKMDKNRN